MEIGRDGWNAVDVRARRSARANSGEEQTAAAAKWVSATEKK